jgi:creatinine amidohydrolase
MEQHAAHMPLNTDSIHAEYFAKIVASHFNAAMLPTLQIANSLEHSGFRGTFSLRPETLMQVVRDLADEAEGQGFRFMIIMNGHGGNFVLTPVCRDINRQDRQLKILMVSSWEFAPAESVAPLRRKTLEVHAGAFETAGMLFIAPEVVRPLEPGPAPAQWDVPFRQSDLTTFGIGHCCPGGNVGDYTIANADVGREMTESAVPPMLRFLEDRMARLRKNGRYGTA